MHGTFIGVIGSSEPEALWDRRSQHIRKRDAGRISRTAGLVLRWPDVGHRDLGLRSQQPRYPLPRRRPVSGHRRRRRDTLARRHHRGGGQQGWGGADLCGGGGTGRACRVYASGMPGTYGAHALGIAECAGPTGCRGCQRAIGEGTSGS